MNSVDTGWYVNCFIHCLCLPFTRVSDEMPYHVAQKRVEMSGLGWEPPLDDIDGASRVLDPVCLLCSLSILIVSRCSLE